MLLVGVVWDAGLRKNVLVESDVGELLTSVRGRFPRVARLDFASTFTVASRNDHAHDMEFMKHSPSL
jgi:hypothetical protein